MAVWANAAAGKAPDLLPLRRRLLFGSWLRNFFNKMMTH
jgi:hypothetical protein